MGGSSVIRAAAALFLAVQVAVPAIQLTRERVSRWGWQMFSAPAPAARIRIEYPDSTETLELPQLLAAPRGEIRPTPELLRRVCEQRAGAVGVSTDAIRETCDR